MAGRIFHYNHPRYKLGTRFLAPSFSAMATASSRLPTTMSKCAICCCFPASSGQVGGHLCILKGQTKTARQFNPYIMFIAFDHLPIKKLCIKIGQRILIGRIQYNGAYKKSVHKRCSLSFLSILLSSQMLWLLHRRYHPFHSARFPFSTAAMCKRKSRIGNASQSKFSYAASLRSKHKTRHQMFPVFLPERNCNLLCNARFGWRTAAANRAFPHIPQQNTNGSSIADLQEKNACSTAVLFAGHSACA